MNARLHAIRAGAARGLQEFRNGLRSSEDLGFYLTMSLAVLGYLFFNRHDKVEGTPYLLPTVMLPSVLGGLVAFGGIIGTAYALAAEREDGTLLRAKSLPHGMPGYIIGHVVRTTLEALPSVSVLLVPGLLLFDDILLAGPSGLLTAVWVLALGMLTAIPIGLIVGSLVSGPSKVGTWGMVPVGLLIAISGIFHPFAALPGWVQDVAQAFPTYWLGLGMRSAFLPDSAAAAEVGGSWRTLETAGVLSAWAVAGLLLAPVVLRRMARRESGSAVERRREQATQRIR
jgi:ABC-2 type transport system permease protein